MPADAVIRYDAWDCSTEIFGVPAPKETNADVRFSNDVRRLILSAQREAWALGHNYVGTEHVLLALVATDNNGSRGVLESLDVTADRVRAEIPRIPGSGQNGTTDGEIPLTQRALRVLRLAACEAHALGHAEVHGEHVLLALLSENDGVAADILGDLAADREQIRQQVLSKLS